MTRLILNAISKYYNLSIVIKIYATSTIRRFEVPKKKKSIWHEQGHFLGFQQNALTIQYGMLAHKQNKLYGIN